MLAFIRGRLEEKSLKEMIVDVAGVGYHALIPMSTYERLPEVGTDVKSYTFNQIRDEKICLYGFLTRQEKDCFLYLLNVSGIGPKMAINILSHLDPATLKCAIINNDIKKLSSISGLGKKTAQRIFIDLKDKIKELSISETGPWKKIEREEFQDAINGLIALGYKSSQAKEAVMSASEKDPGDISTGDLIKKALKFLR